MNDEKNRVDWTLPRKNFNPLTKKPYQRGRNWSVIVYPDSAPENWEDILKIEPVAISPLHDMDVNADGERKKAHYHVVFSYRGNKSFEQIDEIARSLHSPVPQRVNSLTGAVRYLVHLDNPEKAQYETKDIKAYSGFDVEACLAMSTGDKRAVLKDMLRFIKDNQIEHFADFINYCISDEAPVGWFEIATERNTLVIKEYIKSIWQKLGGKHEV